MRIYFRLFNSRIYYKNYTNERLYIYAQSLRGIDLLWSVLVLLHHPTNISKADSKGFIERATGKCARIVISSSHTTARSTILFKIATTELVGLIGLIGSRCGVNIYTVN